VAAIAPGQAAAANRNRYYAAAAEHLPLAAAFAGIMSVEPNGKSRNQVEILGNLKK
jgi:hypothetical protein